MGNMKAVGLAPVFKIMFDTLKNMMTQTSAAEKSCENLIFWIDLMEEQGRFEGPVAGLNRR